MTAKVCPLGPDPRHHRFGEHVKDGEGPSRSTCRDCGLVHTYKAGGGRERPDLPVVVQPEDFVALVALASLGLRSLTL